MKKLWHQGYYLSSMKKRKNNGNDGTDGIAALSETGEKDRAWEINPEAYKDA